MKKLPLPNAAAFVKYYGNDHSYWYFPKGKSAADVKTLVKCLRALKKFEAKKPWRDTQAAYIAALNSAKISDANETWEGGGAPFARMLVQVFRILGLAWVNGKDLIEITDAGNLLLKSADPASILSSQIERYQFYNPSISSKDHRSVQLHPLPFLAEVMSILDDQVITAREYELFVSKAKTHQQVEEVAEQIEAWREMTEQQHVEIVSKLDKFMVGGAGRSSIRNTIALNRPYATSALALSGLIQRRSDGGLEFTSGGRAKYRKFLKAFDTNHAFIDFRSEKDWVAYIGNPEMLPTRETALEYYVKIGAIEKAVITKQESSATKSELKDFKEMLVSEKAIEDYLETNLADIGGPLGIELEMVGRQYPTTVGPIDILCRNRKTKQFIVVELKKGRSADKVFGQISRYMGWVKTNLAAGRDVAGIIVARSFDEKIKAARAAHRTDIKLVEFAMKVGAKVIH